MAPSRGRGASAGRRIELVLFLAMLLTVVGLFVALFPRSVEHPTPGSIVQPSPLSRAVPSPPPRAAEGLESSSGGGEEDGATAAPPTPLPLVSSQQGCGAGGRSSVVIAETKHPYICSYMHGAAAIRGGCAPRCPRLPPGVQCRVLADPSGPTKESADAVVYHPGRGLPVRRGHAKQLQVMWYGESMDKHPEKYKADYLSQYDIHVVFKQWSPHRFSWTQRFLPDFAALPQNRPNWPAWSKRRTAVAVVSNCKYTTTNRTAIMQELDRQLQLQSGGKERLHMFGKCHPGRPRDAVSKEHPQCRARSEKAKYQEKMCVLRQYRYVLAMDNSRDPDYVTEKVYHALLSGAVPIYDGAPNIKDYIPLPDAIVDMRDRRGVAAVAAEMLASAQKPPPQLRWLNTPPEQWSAPFRRNLYLPDPACSICEDVLCGAVRSPEPGQRVGGEQ
eukprot:Hpha_TRINITY_DN15244_c0_g1::TRINITY_DN15244_c0_g1_i1::g.65149::m.65149